MKHFFERPGLHALGEEVGRFGVKIAAEGLELGGDSDDVAMVELEGRVATTSTSATDRPVGDFEFTELGQLVVLPVGQSS